LDKDDWSLAAVGLGHGQNVVISKVLGRKTSASVGMEDKNKQFVGIHRCARAKAGRVPSN
jgi:hypothetical protein